MAKRRSVWTPVNSSCQWETTYMSTFISVRVCHQSGQPWKHHQVEGQDHPSIRWLSVSISVSSVWTTSRESPDDPSFHFQRLSTVISVDKLTQAARDHQMTPAFICSDCSHPWVCHQSGQWQDSTRWAQLSVTAHFLWSVCYQSGPVQKSASVTVHVHQHVNCHQSFQDITSQPQLSISVTVHVHQQVNCHQSVQDITSQPQLSISVTVHVHQHVNCHQSVWTGHHQSTPAVNFSDCPHPSACQLSSVNLDRTSSLNRSCQFQWPSTSISMSTVISLFRTSPVNPSCQFQWLSTSISMSAVISQSGQDITSQPQLSILVTVHIHQRVNCHQSIWTGHHHSTPAVNFSDCPHPSVCQLSSVNLDRTSPVNPSCQFQWLCTSISMSTVISLDRTSSVNPSCQFQWLSTSISVSSVNLDRTSSVNPSCQFQRLSTSISVSTVISQSGQDITSQPQLSISVTVHIHQRVNCHQSGQDIISQPQLSISVTVYIHQCVNCHQSGQDIISQPQLSISVTVHIHQRVNCHQSIWTGHHQSTPAVNFSGCPRPSACQLSSVWTGHHQSTPAFRSVSVAVPVHQHVNCHQSIWTGHHQSVARMVEWI